MHSIQYQYSWIVHWLYNMPACTCTSTCIHGWWVKSISIMFTSTTIWWVCRSADIKSIRATQTNERQREITVMNRTSGEKKLIKTKQRNKTIRKWMVFRVRSLVSFNHSLPFVHHRKHNLKLNIRLYPITYTFFFD